MGPEGCSCSIARLVWFANLVSTKLKQGAVSFAAATLGALPGEFEGKHNSFELELGEAAAIAVPSRLSRQYESSERSSVFRYQPPALVSWMPVTRVTD